MTTFGYIPRMEYNRISDSLLAGRNPLVAGDIERLAAEGVTHFLDLREEREWIPPRLGAEALAAIESRGLVRMHLPIPDGGTPMNRDLDAAAAFLMETLSVPGRQVYVHCRAGLERTAAVLIAYYVRRFAYGYDRALEELRKGRPALFPLSNQEAVVKRWIQTNGVKRNSPATLPEFSEE